MVRILDNWLTDSDTGFEWGSGRSTVWFAEKVEQLTTIEHNAEWARTVAHLLVEKNLRGKVELLTISTIENSGTYDYVDAVDSISNDSLDFCLVDGKLRDRCALKALEKLRSGGVLIVDNVERYLPRSCPTNSPNSRNNSRGHQSEMWKEFSEKVSDWRHIWSSNGIFDTALWVKP